MNQDEELLILMAFRYALGRRTYVVSFIVDLILEKWHLFSEHTKASFKSEIKQHEKLYGDLGHDCDKDYWYKILEKKK